MHLLPPWTQIRAEVTIPAAEANHNCLMGKRSRNFQQPTTKTLINATDCGQCTGKDEHK